MAIISFKNVEFCYPTRNTPTVSGITLDIAGGDFVLISGPTGCGKTTLLKMLNGIIPHLSKGTLRGRLDVAGFDVASSPMGKLTKEVGLIFQNPDDQIVSNTVEEEVAFGLENLGLERDEITARIEWALQKTGISGLKSRDTNKLSGGQKQRVVIASQIAMRPKILAFDEPLSQLDPQGAQEVMRCVEDLNRQGLTIIMIEHRVADVARYANKVILMDKGEVIYYGDVNQSFRTEKESFKRLGIQMPQEAALSLGLGLPEITFSQNRIEEEIKKRGWKEENGSLHRQAERNSRSEQEKIISLEDIGFEYTKGTPVFKKLNLSFYSGETVALMGANGSGKSTLVSLIAGINKPKTGKVTFNNGVWQGSGKQPFNEITGLLIQNPDFMLFCETVAKELLFGPEHKKVRRGEAQSRVDEVLGKLNLPGFREDAPFSLSAGQRLRVALGAVLTMQNPVLLLDEPTTGQNQENILKVMAAVKSMLFIKTIIFCTHDIHTALAYSDRVIVLNEGKAVYDGLPKNLFDNFDLAQKCGLNIPVTVVLSKRCGFKSNIYAPEELISLLRREVKQ